MPAIMISPSSVSFPATTQGSTNGPTSVTITNSGTGTLNIASVAFGGSNPADFTDTNGCNGAALMANATCTISLTFAPAGTASGQLSETLTLTDNAPNSPQVVNVSGTANPIAIALTPPASAISTSGAVSFSATGDPLGVTWSVVGAPFLGSPSVIASPGVITSTGMYSGPGSGPSFYATVTATSVTNLSISSHATVNVVAPGVFTTTNNLQVAQYSVALPSPASASVQFGLTTSYGLNTWTVPSPSNLVTPLTLYVAGMKQSTPYHMQGLIQFADGSSFSDADYTFTTGAIPVAQLPVITATTTPGMTPQPGVELLDTVVVAGGNGKVTESAVSDLSGNVLWTYAPNLGGPGPNPVKLLPNGHFLINFSGQPDGEGALMQEVDLGGNVIWQMTPAQLNTALAAATCAECNVTIIGTHHDFAVLPNGHIIVIASTTETLADGTMPTGDVIIDLGDMENVSGNNPNHTPQPVWAWNEFNHFDTNRRPYSYPDWMHTNAVIYSPSDGNLIISMRHQNWLAKIPYQNGTGSGDAIWKLGAVLPTDTGADVANFMLLNADGSPDTTATDWFFAQHGPSFTTTNTSGQFGLTLFDNGDDRGVVDVAGGTCGTGQPVACYSTVPNFILNETAFTATLVLHPTTVDYSWFGGNAELLANGNTEYDECDTLMGTDNAAVYEITKTATPQTVWKMQIAGQDAYRAFRIPSLYPGVQW